MSPGIFNAFVHDKTEIFPAEGTIWNDFWHRADLYRVAFIQNVKVSDLIVDRQIDYSKVANIFAERELQSQMVNVGADAEFAKTDKCRISSIWLFKNVIFKESLRWRNPIFEEIFAVVESANKRTRSYGFWDLVCEVISLFLRVRFRALDQWVVV